MSEKQNEVGNKDILEVLASGEALDDFDLSVLEKDIENAEKEAQELINQKLIDQADFQKNTEIVQGESERIQGEVEKIQTFKEAIVEALEFLFSFVNRKLDKRDVSKFDNEFINEFVDKFLKVIPKDKIGDVEKYLGAGDKSKASLTIFRMVKLLMFISQEIYKRFDEYELYRETHDKPKLAFRKKDASEDT